MVGSVQFLIHLIETLLSFDVGASCVAHIDNMADFQDMFQFPATLDNVHACLDAVAVGTC